MNGYATLEYSKLLDINKLKTAESGNLPATAGTFLLRRSHYLNETRAQLGVLLSQTSVVISFENEAYKHRRVFENVFNKHRRT